jgi:hypothetical protein
MTSPVDARSADVSDWRIYPQGTDCFSIHDSTDNGPIAYDFPSVEAAEAFISMVRKHGSRRLTASKQALAA